LVLGFAPGGDAGFDGFMTFCCGVFGSARGGTSARLTVGGFTGRTPCGGDCDCAFGGAVGRAIAGTLFQGFPAVGGAFFGFPRPAAFAFWVVLAVILGELLTCVFWMFAVFVPEVPLLFVTCGDGGFGVPPAMGALGGKGFDTGAFAGRLVLFCVASDFTLS
jgi:hypothetical protein